MRKPIRWTRAKIESHEAVHSVVIQNRRYLFDDCYRVLIYLNDGWRNSSDRTSTLYGATLQEAGENLVDVERGEVE